MFCLSAQNNPACTSPHAPKSQQVKPDKQMMVELKREYIKKNFVIEEAQKKPFWEAYEKYTAAEMSAYKEMQAQRKALAIPSRGDSTALTDDQILQKHALHLQTKRKILVASETFFEDLKKVLTPQQIDNYYRLEKRFVKTVVAKRDPRMGGKGEGQSTPSTE